MYLPIAIIAYLLNGIAVTIDKILLNKVIPEPLTYIFYLSLLSLLALFALPLTHTPTAAVLILASVSTILWTFGAYFMFKALKVGQISRVIPVIGTLNPLILFVIAVWAASITTSQIWAVILLILGMIFLTLTDWKGKITKRELLFELLSASCFAFSYLILKQAYLKEDTFTVLVWSRFVLIPVALIFLGVPILRSKVLPTKNAGVNILKKGGLLFTIGQASGSISQLLIFFAISLGNPAIVNSLQGTQYIFLFILALILSKKYPQIFKEKHNSLMLFSKFVGVLLIGLGLYLLTYS